MMPIQTPYRPARLLALCMAAGLTLAGGAVRDGIGGQYLPAASLAPSLADGVLISHAPPNLLQAPAGVLRADSVPSSTSAPAATQPARTFAAAQESYNAGRYEEAAEIYQQLAAEPANRVRATVGLARCHLIAGRYDEVTRVLSEVEKEAGQEPEWLVVAAELNAALGRYEEAIEAAQHALKSDSGHFRARRVLGELLETVGKPKEAIEVYRWFDELLANRFPPDANAVTETAIGFHRFNVLTTHPNLSERTQYVLNELLQPAYTRMDRTCWAARVAAGDLLHSKYNLEDAAEDYQAALSINPNLAVAHLGLGRIALDGWDFDKTEQSIEKALAIQPRCVPALALRAEQKIVERRYEEALETCRRGLEINPNDIRVLSLAAAAARALHDDETGEAMQARVRKVNPRPALLHSVLGDVLGGLRQYEDSERHYLLAIEYDPTDANTRCELGMMYMQWGEEGKARDALQAAWALDDFNARTQNTLDLLDSLAKFATLETEHFIIRYDPNTDSVLPRYMAAVLEEIHPELCADYATQPEHKTVIEVFPSLRAFAVRITGKPWIYTVGACTGRIIALSSPRHDPKLSGPYNYAQVLRHEFTHTITLAATRNRIAHWYTEGLAVLQEDSPRSFDWCRMLAERVRRGELFTLESIDWGFMRPKKADDRTAAYAQSEWMCEFLVERYGFDVLNRMLAGFREGLSQEQVFIKETGKGCEDFDREFGQWTRKQVESWGFPLDPPEGVEKLRLEALSKPDDAALLARWARAELDADKVEKALEAAGRALALDENEKIALEVKIKALMSVIPRQESRAARLEMEDDVLEAARRLSELDSRNWTAPKATARLLLDRELFDEAEAPLKQLQKSCPMDPFSYAALAGIYLQRKEADAALTQLLELVRLDDQDADVPARIAEIHARRDKLSEARFWYMQSIHIDAFNPATHAALAEVLMRMNDTAAAVREYEVLCELQPQVARHFADAAMAYRKLGETEKSNQFARRAVELDPASPARALLEAAGGTQ